jgi:protein dithiol:quinone oxidoreductase
MKGPSTRLIWVLLAGGCAVATAASFLMTDWLGLEPCHLCIFQRLLFMVLTVLGIGAALAAGRLGTGVIGRVLGGLTIPISAAGVGVAGYQSWLQHQPLDTVSCVGGPPGPIERWVEWLARYAPDLFMATGFCEDESLVILGLSLANWALIAFALCLAAAVWALWRSRSAAQT